MQKNPSLNGGLPKKLCYKLCHSHLLLHSSTQSVYRARWRIYYEFLRFHMKKNPKAPQARIFAFGHIITDKIAVKHKKHPPNGMGIFWILWFYHLVIEKQGPNPSWNGTILWWTIFESLGTLVLKMRKIRKMLLGFLVIGWGGDSW